MRLIGWLVDRIARGRVRALDKTIATAPPGADVLVATSLVDKAQVLYELGRQWEVVAVCDEIVERYADQDDPALQAAVAEALFNKAVAIGDSGDPWTSISVYRDLRTRFTDVHDIDVRVHVEPRRAVRTRRSSRRRTRGVCDGRRTLRGRRGAVRSQAGRVGLPQSTARAANHRANPGVGVNER